VLATWRQLVDDATLSMDEPHLAGTGRTPYLRCSPGTAARLGLTEGGPASVATERGAIALPVALADLPEGVVWLPGHSPGSHVRETLGAGHGALVTVTPGGNREADSERASRGTVAGEAGGVGRAQRAPASEERNERGGEQ
jgi:NADH-quinone oxidoreductase subunit G